MGGPTREERFDMRSFSDGIRKGKQQTKKKELAKKNPEQYNYLKMIWDVRNRHIVPNLPEKYVFMLLPCFQKDCPRKVCAQGKKNWYWYDGGLSLSALPLPVPDPQRPWGGTCKTCSGHYLPSEEAVEYVKRNGIKSCSQPPSIVIKAAIKILMKTTYKLLPRNVFLVCLIHDTWWTI